ncbi:hypothetical protein CW304_17885 [Bacillus sp. UFRGS-B20]|nr:hypothetical protein CW304_17885 [Bacillus sp. UFRGS-B20]
MHKEHYKKKCWKNLLESATRFTDIPAYLQFIDEAILKVKKEMKTLKTSPKKRPFHLCQFITQKP